MIVSDYTDDENTIVASLLHDTLEDTDYTETELRDDFGGVVMELVVSISKPAVSDEGRANIIEQNKQYIKKLRSASERALVIVAADKIHNMRSVVEEYFEDHSAFIADFGTSLNDRLLMYQEMSNALNRTLKNAILSEFNSVFTEYKNFIHDVEKKRDNY
jgi:(p)ppGpp synthase/HD superfamily hydrolase